jgi:hypothetical protein
MTASQSKIYGQEGFKVFAYNPGVVVSTLGPRNNAENGAMPTSQGTAPTVKISNGDHDDEHGELLSAAGQYPW